MERRLGSPHGGAALGAKDLAAALEVSANPGPIEIPGPGKVRMQKDWGSKTGPVPSRFVGHRLIPSSPGDPNALMRREFACK
jgi:hypothetical protein